MMENNNNNRRRRCQFWLPKKNRFCANPPLSNHNDNSQLLCGNHTNSGSQCWVQCPIDPSHNVLVENVQGHKKRCPFLKQAQSLSLQPYYLKGINAGSSGDSSSTSGVVSSEMKRNGVFSMTPAQLSRLLSKIQSVHSSICKDIHDSYKIPKACSIWINHQIHRKLPFKEKHVHQQASILGNLEEFGIFKNYNLSAAGEEEEHTTRGCGGDAAAVVEFGAGRAYLTQMLADCFGINKVFLVERKSYKLKADRSLRQIESLILQRLRIDIEDLNLNAVESLQGVPYLAIGKHLCGPATDMTLRCCFVERYNQDSIASREVSSNLRGLAIATCCHHLCQWKHYINKSYFTNLGITKEDFHAITWFTSWAVDADHSSDLSDDVDCSADVLQTIGERNIGEDVEGILKDLKAVERAALGFMCKDIIDMGRLMWLKQQRGGGLQAQLVKYVPPNISPENRLLVAV